MNRKGLGRISEKNSSGWNRKDIQITYTSLRICTKYLDSKLHDNPSKRLTLITKKTHKTTVILKYEGNTKNITINT